MQRALKLLFGMAVIALLLLGAAGSLIYFVYLVPVGAPAPAGYSFDLAKARELANAMPGAKPVEIRVETVATFNWPELLTMANGRFGAVEMGCFAYQLVTPTGHYIIDTAMDATLAAQMPGTTFHADAYDRMQSTIGTADLIAITHEHPDHLGGLTKHPDVKSLHPALRLTADQISDPARHQNPEFAPGALDGYEPLEYDDMLAIGPGVVLIKAPGHTHGSQLVFVELADGREVLFLGDVAWMWANVQQVTPRPRLISEFVLPGGEDRSLVHAELQFLNALTQSEPDLLQIPGHDMVLTGTFMRDGVIKPLFVTADAPEPVDVEAGDSSTATSSDEP